MPGYRQAVRRCELCLRELGAEEQLQPHAGLQACAGCLDTPNAAVRAWKLDFDSQQVDLEKQGRYGSEGVRTTVEVRLPTDVGIKLTLRQQHLFTGGDPEIGDRAFDDAVRIEEQGGAADYTPLLSDATVQTAVIEAVAAAEQLTLSGALISLTCRQRSFSLEQLERIDRAAVALGVAVERWARGDPASTTLRDGCQPAAPPQEQEQEQEQELSPAKVEPKGPPCPSCGKPMIPSVEYICRWCDLTVPRPKLARRRRKKTLITALIVAAAVLLTIALIILSAVHNNS